MKALRLGYLVYVMVLAGAHILATMAFWGTPELIMGGQALKATVFLALFGGWILAGVSDLALSAYGLLPLSFAGEAALANASLAILTALTGGFCYVLCAFVAPLLVLSKGVSELGHAKEALRHA